MKGGLLRTVDIKKMAEEEEKKGKRPQSKPELKKESSIDSPVTKETLANTKRGSPEKTTNKPGEIKSMMDRVFQRNKTGGKLSKQQPKKEQTVQDRIKQKKKTLGSEEIDKLDSIIRNACETAIPEPK